MPGKHTAGEMLDREFLEIRCRLLAIAAALDRIDRAEGADAIRSDPRITKLHDAVRILIDGRPDRSQRMQMVFSDPYDEAWRDR